MTTVKKIDYYISDSEKIRIHGRGRTYTFDELKKLNSHYYLIY